MLRGPPRSNRTAKCFPYSSPFRSALQGHGVRLRHPLWVLDFLSEEPSDYGAACVGSSALVGTLTPAMLAARNAGGEALGAAIARMGGDPKQLGHPLLDRKSTRLNSSH